MTSSTDFHGLPARRLGSPPLSLDYLAEAGPRIVRLSLAGQDRNLLAELPGLRLPTSIGDFSLRGGHRLWHSPEATPRSYVPDDAGLTVEDLPDGVRLVGPTEALTGVRKSIEVRLAPDRPAVFLRHLLLNEGVWPVELAPWGITMLPLGGTAILPQTVGALDPASLLPNRQLVLWPYTSWTDPRLRLTDDVVLLQAEPRLPPCKVGYLNRQGWLAYWRDGILFVKRFEARAEEPHPDFGCNAEFYCNDQFLEMESLGPLVHLEPGQLVEHGEIWELYPAADFRPTLEAIHAITRG